MAQVLTTTTLWPHQMAPHHQPHHFTSPLPLVGLQPHPPAPAPPSVSFSLLSALPADIIYEITDYLSNTEVLKLQLVSRGLRRKLPIQRLNSIHSHKTYFLCQDGIRKLERIARIPRLAKRVTHITFDLESPYVGLLKRYWCISTAMGYPQETRARMQRWYHNHMRRSLTLPSARRIKDKSLRASALKRILKRMFTGHGEEGGSLRTKNREEEEEAEEEEPTKYEDAFHEIFTLFEVHLTSLYLKWQDKAEILERITSAFRSLPNLQILEFKRTDITKEDPSVMLKIWREYNPELAWLLKKNPEIEDGDLPWTDWFSREALHSHLWEAYPSILFCAAQAKRRIKEVRVGTLSTEYPKSGAMISFFEPYHARISDTTGRQATETELNSWIERHAEGYRYTFSGLRRLELCLDEKEREGYHREYFEVSPLFTETIRTVEDLVVWKVQGSEVRREENTTPKEFVVPTTMKLEKLRRIELGKVGITLRGLKAFLLTNKETVKEVVCGEGTFGHNVMEKEEILDFLEQTRDNMSLENIEVDFLVGNQYRRLIDEKKYFLSVRIHGNWRDQAFCGFDIGLKYRFTTISGEDTVQSHWVRKHSYEEFVKFIAVTDVQEHFEIR
ncbi:hypothetical protein TWF225_006909 [Orbilia oligospora]|nr:hypothetical protein TWF225_006909 [Orbilia oligospora]KAF3246217.1 hypothetical protein TWF128_009026 [Orbilia oligospora]KAF3264114.1 hypothetical protein TWF217_003270 [Orbilia oligospora]KAF3296138.1 hypothetical protein TWF132_011602 [Orbilia oligospora]